MKGRLILKTNRDVNGSPMDWFETVEVELPGWDYSANEYEVVGIEWINPRTIADHTADT